MREFDRKRANITQSTLAALLAIGSTACGTNAASGQGGPEASKNPAPSPTREEPKFPFSGTWYLTAGPHTDGYAQNGELYALDFAPKPVIACPGGPTPTDYLVEASASGKVTVVGNPNDRTDPHHSVVKIEHPDGSVLGYMHLDNIKVTKGQEVQPGEPLGNPSCEIPPGGKTTGVHVHQFLEKLGKGKSVIGSIISGWKVEEDGRLTKAGEIARQGNAARCDTAQSCGGVRNDLTSSQAQTANPKEGATPLPTVPEITPTIAVPVLNPTEAPKPQPTPKPFKIGDDVVVAGASPECLMQRVAPGTSTNTIKYTNGSVVCFPDGKRFIIQDGPVYKDGYNWWRTTLDGWSVDTYLNLVPPEVPPPPGWLRHKSREIGYSIDYMPATWSVIQENNPHGGFQNKFQENIKAVYPPQIVVGNEPINGRTLDEIARLTEGGFLQTKQPGVNTVILENSRTKVAGRDAIRIKARMTISLLPNRSDLDTSLDMTYTVFIDNGKGWAFFMLNDSKETGRLLPVYNHMIDSFRH